MILSRQPLHNFTPLQRSANGVREVQFDKDDAESLGLVKLDILGLRMLATLSEAVEIINRHIDLDFEIDSLPLDDAETFELIQASKTLGCFQIESMGQLHLLAQNQPEVFDDLIIEVALFRPGPLQSGMVNPFIRRRRGLEPVQYDHALLEPILRDTYGVILFQEQVLEIAYRFSGMSLSEADEFRRLMSHFRDPVEMGAMRGQFVDGAVQNNVPEQVANHVFDQVAAYVGYGFCRSHAAAFAKTVYQSCFLKCHYPAAYMAAVMEHLPGMYDQQTLEAEARNFGVAVLPPCIQRSNARFDIQAVEEGWAIRKSLTSIANLSPEHARLIVLERLRKPFANIEDLHGRVALPHDVLDNLARSGALRMLEEQRRTALWKLGVLKTRLDATQNNNAPTLFAVPSVSRADVPPLPLLREAERLSWDLQTHSAAARHPVTLIRRHLKDLEVRPVETCYGITNEQVQPEKNIVLSVGGRVMLRQQPETARGVMFLSLEDETGFIQCIVLPHIKERFRKELRQSALIVRGKVEIDGNWGGLLVQDVWPLEPLMGGYTGYASAAGGRDRLVSMSPLSNHVHLK